MTILSESKKAQNRIYVDIYLKRKYPDGSFDSEWIDISRWFLGDGIGNIKYSLDSGDYDFGIFAANSVRISLNNSSGKFNDVDDPRSYWAGFETRNLAKFRIEAGYLDDDYSKVQGIAFDGYIEEKSLNIDEDDKVSVTILSNDNIFKTVDVVSGTLSSSILASEALYILCNRGEITDYINVTEANINPANDIILDEPSSFDGKKLDSVLDEILLITNSIMYVDDDSNMIIRNRNATKKVIHRFYRNSFEGKKDNIYKISSMNNGRHRLKNYFSWSSTALVSFSDSYLLKRYGVSKKTISSAAVTNSVVQQSVLDFNKNEWQYPKREMIIETDYIPGVLNFFDTVTLDVNPRLSRYDDIPISGDAISEVSTSLDWQTGLKINKNIGFKVLSIEHDLRNSKSIIKLREKGNQLHDGYIQMTISAHYTIDFVAATQVDLDVGGEGINAQYCKVEPLDTASDYKTAGITISRPDSQTIRFESGAAITKTFRILVVEVEH